MNLKKITLVLTLPFFVLACGNAEDNSSSTNIPSESGKTASPALSLTSPCELISSKEITTICEVGSNFEILQEDKVLTYPTCTFEWEDGKVNRSMEIGGTAVNFDMPSEVLIVMVKNANEKMFEQSTSVYKDGVDVKVGDKAIWGTKMAQLSFLAKGFMFHVHVKVNNDDEVNKQKAMEIAKLVIGKL